MSYRIEITADTLAELAGKAASLAAKLNTGTAIEAPSNPIMPELREVAEAAPVDPTQAPKSAPVAEASESQPTTEELSSTPAPATLDYKTEVAPLVLKLVEVSGKPAAQRVLDQFGAAKASDISPDLWPELVAVIKAEMAQ